MTTARSASRKKQQNFEKSQVFSIRVPARRAEEIKNLALLRGLKPAQLIAIILQDYLGEKSKKDFVENLSNFISEQAIRELSINSQLIQINSKIEKLNSDFQAVIHGE